MKNTNRIHKNGSATRTNSQAKTQPEENITVIFYSVETDKELARVEFPNTFYRRILRCCKILKCAPGRFFELAVRSKIERDEIVPNPKAPLMRARLVPGLLTPAKGGAQCNL